MGKERQKKNAREARKATRWSGEANPRSEADLLESEEERETRLKRRGQKTPAREARKNSRSRSEEKVSPEKRGRARDTLKEAGAEDPRPRSEEKVPLGKR